MDSKSKEHALEYALILGVGALLLVLVFVNIHSRIFA
jgi:Flp pilus assembly pilin Flp